MTSSPPAHHVDYGQSSTNEMSGSVSGTTTSGVNNAALNAHPSQRSVLSVDEESPLLSLGEGQMQNGLGDHQTRDNLETRSPDSIHISRHVDRNAIHSTDQAVNTSNPSLPEPISFIPSVENSRRIHSDGSIPMTASSPHFLLPQNLPPTTTPVFETQNSQRRRRRNRQRINSSSLNNETPASATSQASGHSNLRRSNPATSTNETAVESDARRGSGNNSLRISLDAGMAAVQRWIRSRSGSATTASEPSSSGRSVTWSNPRESTCEVISLSSRSAGINHHGDEESFNGQRSNPNVYHPTIFEEDEDALGRQRALSESDAMGIRDFLRTMRQGGRARRRRGRTGGNAENNNARQLSSSAAAALHTTTDRTFVTSDGTGPLSAQTQNMNIPPANFLFTPSPGPISSLRERSVTDGGLDSYRYMEPLEMSGPFVVDEASSVSTETSVGTGGDSERRARARWIQINRRFQFVITAVALLFSLLLFGILICWVVLTSAYVVSFDRSCDVPLKPYFWLVTFQLVLDVFRTDIMRFVFSWDSSSNQRIPARVIAYNVTYLLYAMLVLRLGIQSVYINNDADCRDTAPELFNASIAFVSLSLAAWATIICGYLLPFFVVASLLTCNGYNPSSDAQQSASGTTQPVFPAAYATTGAPPGTVELLHVLQIDDFPDDYPRECCICMETFGRGVIVETSCKHVFHKRCCREWLRQARSCPVCRMDIPLANQNNLERNDRPNSTSSVVSTAEEVPAEAPRIPIGPTGRPVVGLLRVLRTQSISFGANSQSESG